ncbi:uncharacterized protein LOC129572566 [Sitodiplosis mosellana]|uniref:uncharacterized protein LOC129572566 n=1 Tax=Sitodiplosis mosellana TaxID=263140 RepID=UPI0024443C03|nr:uncharacterized protein LOC129572566 [Sitodiplosis mosellana]
METETNSKSLDNADAIQKHTNGTTRKTYTKLDFSLEEEEQLIDFVKSNPPLYNPRDERFKNKMFRDRLWAKFGETIKKTGPECNKKWVNIRDTYNKNKGKKLGTGSAALAKKKRNDLLAFIDEIVTVNKKTTTNIAGKEDEKENVIDDDIGSDEEYFPRVKRRRSSSNSDHLKFMENIAQTMKENNTKRNEILQHMLTEQKPQSELELFFSSICKTVEKFSPIDQVRVKMQINQMVSETELAILECTCTTK